MNKGNIIAISNIKNTLQKIKNPAQDIIHSDHGKEYTSNMFNNLKEKYNFKHSMGRIGIALDNHPIEYFFSILKQEYLKSKEILNYKELSSMIDFAIYDYNNIRFRRCLNNKTLRRCLNNKTPLREEI